MDASKPPKPFHLKRLDSQAANIRDLFLEKYGRPYYEAFLHNTIIERGVIWISPAVEVYAIAFHELTKDKSQ